MPHETDTIDSACPDFDVRKPDMPERLTVTDLARLLAPRLHRATIVRFDANEDLRALLGKKGMSYPAGSLRYWEAIASAREQVPPIVSPQTAGVFVRSLIEQEGQGNLFGLRTPSNPAINGQNGQELSAIAPLAGNRDTLTQETLDILRYFAVLIVEALDTHARPLPNCSFPDDVLLDVAGVKQLVPMSARWLRANMPSVKVGRRRLWRKSDALAFIAGLEGGSGNADR